MSSNRAGTRIPHLIASTAGDAIVSPDGVCRLERISNGGRHSSNGVEERPSRGLAVARGTVVGLMLAIPVDVALVAAARWAL
jgi:hypothetical protein